MCCRPLPAFIGPKKANGKMSLVWKHGDSVRNQRLNIPCGQCAECRLGRRRDWAFRCMAEASLYEENCFITLTYSPEKLPKNGSLDVREFQLFMKRLRKLIAPRKVRFFHCGEYGSKRGRPHYHALLFGYNFPDRKVCGKSGENNLYSSQIADGLWDNGFVVIGDLTFDSASYVAKYCTKKLNGYLGHAMSDGRSPEYATMSRRPGIGRAWFERFKSDVYPSDEVIVKGKSFRPPRYFDNLLSESERASLKMRRINKMFASGFKAGRTKWRGLESFDPETFEDRLYVKEQVAVSKIPGLERDCQ